MTAARRPRFSAMPTLGQNTLLRLFARRHESPEMRAVMACPYHPEHRWWTLRVGDVVKNCGDPDERMTICRACYVPRCGSTGDVDRCKLWRHHETEHVYESGAQEAVGGF